MKFNWIGAAEGAAVILGVWVVCWIGILLGGVMERSKHKKALGWAWAIFVFLALVIDAGYFIR